MIDKTIYLESKNLTIEEWAKEQQREREEFEAEIKRLASEAKLVTEWVVTVIAKFNPIHTQSITKEDIEKAFETGFIVIDGDYFNIQNIISFEQEQKYYNGDEPSKIEVLRYITHGKIIKVE